MISQIALQAYPYPMTPAVALYLMTLMDTLGSASSDSDGSSKICTQRLWWVLKCSMTGEQFRLKFHSQ